MRKVIIALLGALLMLSFTTPAHAAMNRIELNSASLVNDERRDAGLRTMTRQSCLQSAADVHASRMAAKRSMYHRDSAALRTLMKRCKLSSIGENLATGRGMTSISAVGAWMKSAGHRRNILNSGYNRIGAAYATGSDGRRYWIQLYGRAA